MIENSQNIKKINKKEQNYRYDFKSKNIKYCIQKQLFGNIALKQAIEMTRPNAEIVRVGMGFKPLEFSINDITSWNKSLIGHMAYDSTSWRNAIRLLESGQIKVQPLITHRLGLSEYEKGFDAMASKEAIKVIFHYDFED